MPELITLAGRAEPIGAGALLAIDTTPPLDLSAVERFLRDAGFLA